MTESPEHPARVVIATAGHVDHGKTSLILALTGVDTDRLPDEKRRGISIELGFAELAGAGISFIDVPGHKKLVHAMIAGVGGVDAALLVVAADDGVMPQTREHLHVLALLGVRRLVVALTKADLVDAEMLELASAELRATLEALGLAAVAVVPTSVTTGRGLEELKAALVSVARSVPNRARSARVWLPIDRVFTIKGAGTVVTGTLTRGRIALGAPLWVVGPRGVLETACRGLEIHGQSVSEAGAPTRVAVNLARLEASEVDRGAALVADPDQPVSRHLDVRITMLPGAEPALGDGSPLIAYVGTSRATARITHLGPNAAHLALDAPLPCLGGAGVVLRGFRSTREHGAVLGGGTVIDARAAMPPKRRDSVARELRARVVEAAASGDWSDALTALMQLAAPRALVAPDVERRFGLEPGEIARWLTGKRRKGPADAIALPGGEAFTTPANVARLIDELAGHVASHHRAHPDQPGISLETLRARLLERAGREMTELALARAGESRRILTAQGVACLPEFATSAGPQAERAAAVVEEALGAAGLEGIGEPALLARLPGERPEAVKAALARLASSTRARRLGGLWFAERHLDELRRRVVGHFASHPVMSVPEFKELAAVSRKQAIPLLEQLDREGTTRRAGDDRVLGAAAKPS